MKSQDFGSLLMQCLMFCCTSEGLGRKGYICKTNHKLLGVPPSLSTAVWCLIWGISGEGRRSCLAADCWFTVLGIVFNGTLIVVAYRMRSALMQPGHFSAEKCDMWPSTTWYDVYLTTFYHRRTKTYLLSHGCLSLSDKSLGKLGPPGSQELAVW